jgi:hypothetical protein
VAGGVVPFLRARFPTKNGVCVPQEQKHKGRLLVGITSMISCIAQTTLHLQLRGATNEWARSSCSLLVEGTRQIKQAVSNTNTNTNSLSMIRDHPGVGENPPLYPWLQFLMAK